MKARCCQSILNFYEHIIIMNYYEHIYLSFYKQTNKMIVSDHL